MDAPDNFNSFLWVPNVERASPIRRFQIYRYPARDIVFKTTNHQLSIAGCGPDNCSLTRSRPPFS
ncbi:hypothetical protein BpHYR1_046473 [Brachionus plicatilis]|uniref:Uncharacterized protein n=1 Tax=Brachionus plicatilis TaxID=10195 RepID=A0A3M7PM55_BRAPC|nr:hypothetical protein BpHYR1_046473 [Brachionus plicatilis]